MKSPDDDVVTMANGDIAMWVDSGNLHLKCVAAKRGDPVELNAEELVELLEALQKCMRWVARP